MKYINLFEAFESEKLSKTLKYIESGDKQKVVTILRRLCEQIDFPFSQLSDDFIEYLSFRKALWKNDMTGDQPCEATSEKEFPGSSIDGEKCTNGKIKRLWGGRPREVVCPLCGGTGVKVKKQELKLLKFWFTKEGRFITTTAVDGIVRNNMKSTKTLSRDLSDFDVLPKRLTLREIKNLQTGQPVFMELRGGLSGIGYIFQANRKAYVMQDFYQGREPYWSSRSNWEKYGQFSHEINAASDYASVKIANIKDNPENVDPYTWNVGLEQSRWDFGRIDTRVNIEDSIKDAHFALVLDFGKIKLSGFDTKTQISDDRKEMRKGALALEKDEDIRKANIKRYMAELAKSVDIVGDISNVNRLVKRYLGGRNALFFIMNTGRFGNALSDIIDYYYRIMSSNENEKQYYVEQLEGKIRSLLNSASTKNQQFSINLEAIRSKCIEDGKEEYATLLDELSKLSQHIFDKFSNLQIETIDDLEIVRQKIYSLKNLLDVSRYGIDKFRNSAEYLDRDSINYSYRYFTDYYIDDPQVIINNLPVIKSLIDKLI
jgi:hypothetical protein